jgi:hypothetical protein
MTVVTRTRALRVAALAGILAWAALPPAVAQTTDAADVRAETAEAVEAIQAYSAEQRDRAVEATRETLADLDAAIDAREAWLRENWSALDEAAREQASESLRAARRARDRLGEWYGAMQHGTAAAWDDVKDGFADAYADLRSAWDDWRQEG